MRLGAWQNLLHRNEQFEILNHHTKSIPAQTRFTMHYVIGRNCHEPSTGIEGYLINWSFETVSILATYNFSAALLVDNVERIVKSTHQNCSVLDLMKTSDTWVSAFVPCTVVTGAVDDWVIGMWSPWVWRRPGQTHDLFVHSAKFPVHKKTHELLSERRSKTGTVAFRLS